MNIPKTAKGMQVAVMLVQQQNPELNNKQIASLFRLSVRRIQQIKNLLEDLEKV
jgi:hypothetical protein